MEIYERISEILEGEREVFYQISDQIWEFAEPRFQEERSSALQQAFMKERGFSVRNDLAGEKTAFIAECGTGKPVIAFLGEFDSLSGLAQQADCPVHDDMGKTFGHGCGHNLLGTGAMAAAFALKQYAEENKLPGTIRYYGCPAEENAGGKTYLVRDGFFDDCDIVLTWHPFNINLVQPSGYLANCRAFFKFKGISAHAGGAPHLGRSALDAVELMDVGTNYLREHMQDEARVHYAITDTGGTAPNVVQSHAEVLYAVRAPQQKDVSELYERVCNIAKGAALMTGTTVEIRQVAAYSNYIACPTINTVVEESMARFLPLTYPEEEEAYAKRFFDAVLPNEQEDKRKALTLCFGKKGVADRMDLPMLNFRAPTPARNIRNNGSTDVGDVSWVVPTGQIDCACWAAGTAGHSWQATAQGKSSIAHKGMLLAAKTLSFAGSRFLTDANLIQQARQAWLEELDGETYRSPLPEGAKPALW